MKTLIDKVAVVTGAGSGIGRSLAINLAKYKCNLAISDINPESLQETAELIAGMNTKTTIHIVDVSDRAHMYQFAEDVYNEHGKVNLLINNAGVSVTDSIDDVSYENFEWLFGINFWGVVYGCKAFIPYLKKNTEGHIVNISSVGGFATMPYYGTYCSSKFAVRGFSLTLNQELSDFNIGVTCVYPGGIKTNLSKNSRIVKQIYESPEDISDPRKFLTSADKAAKIIIKAIRKNKPNQLIGTDAKLLNLLSKVSPNLLVKITKKLATRSNTK